MHVEIKTNGYTLSSLDRDRLDQAIAHIDRLTDTYPNRRIHVSIEKFGHSEECQVRMLLALARLRLVAVDRAPSVAPAAQRCVDILSEQIQLKKERIHKNHGERAVRRAKEEAGIFDQERLRIAHIDGDYEAFKTALGQVPDMLEAEVARRIKFHPDAEALVGDAFTFDDVIEAIVFDAFENFVARPENVPLREWLLSKIDDTIDEVAKDALAEREANVRPSDFAA